MAVVAEVVVIVPDQTGELPGFNPDEPVIPSLDCHGLHPNCHPTATSGVAIYLRSLTPRFPKPPAGVEPATY
jgi:hypothetical protein